MAIEDVTAAASTAKEAYFAHLEHFRNIRGTYKEHFLSTPVEDFWVVVMWWGVHHLYDLTAERIHAIPGIKKADLEVLDNGYAINSLKTIYLQWGRNAVMELRGKVPMQNIPHRGILSQLSSIALLDPGPTGLHRSVQKLSEQLAKRLSKCRLPVPVQDLNRKGQCCLRFSDAKSYHHKEAGRPFARTNSVQRPPPKRRSTAVRMTSRKRNKTVAVPDEPDEHAVVEQTEESIIDMTEDPAVERIENPGVQQTEDQDVHHAESFPAENRTPLQAKHNDTTGGHFRERESLDQGSSIDPHPDAEQVDPSIQISTALTRTSQDENPAIDWLQNLIRKLSRLKEAHFSGREAHTKAEEALVQTRTAINCALSHGQTLDDAIVDARKRTDEIHAVRRKIQAHRTVNDEMVDFVTNAGVAHAIQWTVHGDVLQNELDARQQKLVKLMGMRDDVNTKQKDVTGKKIELEGVDRVYAQLFKKINDTAKSFMRVHVSLSARELRDLPSA